MYTRMISSSFKSKIQYNFVTPSSPVVTAQNSLPQGLGFNPRWHSLLLLSESILKFQCRHYTECLGFDVRTLFFALKGGRLEILGSNSFRVVAFRID